jgi:hypothetical protein
MKTVGDLLRDADPLRADPPSTGDQRDRLRRAIVAAADAAVPVQPPRRRALWLAAAAAIAIGIAVSVPQFWPHGGATLQAAVRFEVRLAEPQPSADLLEAPGAAGAVIYLHREVVVTNDDIARARVVAGDGPSSFAIAVEFTPEGAEKMRHATAAHVGRPVAILIDGNVVMAPVVRSPIGASAVITGNYSQAEAERIVNGLMKN